MGDGVDETTPQTLPSWLTETAGYEPAGDRDGYLRKNVLALAGMLRVFRPGGVPSCAVDRMLCRVQSALRVIGLVLSVLLVSLAHNMAFVWLMLAATLALLAARPAPIIAAVVGPAALACALAVVVNLPAAIMLSQTSAPLRIASKTFVTVTLTCLVARTTAPETLLGGLASLGLPGTAALTVDLAIRDLALIGTEARRLAEALELRCVGRNRDKTASTAGVVGTCLLKAARHSREQAEAMALRGYDGTVAGRRLSRPTAADALYCLAMALVCASFAYLELAP